MLTTLRLPQFFCGFLLVLFTISASFSEERHVAWGNVASATF
jgi:hypothetical protein